MSQMLALYHWLPGPARSVAASLRGYYLRSWRYGQETDRLVSEALDREKWSLEKWKRWQEQRLACVLHRAATKVPYYREQWATRRRKGDRASWEYLENWPILEKDTLRASASAFVAADCKIQNMFHEHTSGTSGTPLNLWWSLKATRMWFALFEARCRGWYGVSRHDRWANIGGQLVSPADQSEPPFWVWNHALNQLYMSSYHLAPHLISHYLDALVRYRCIYLVGYSSSLYALAQAIQRLGRSDLKMLVAITLAEPLLEYQRNVIRKAFQCPVRETYGMAEIVAAASECEDGRLHLWPEVGWTEILNNGEEVTNGATGDLVCTGLLNEDMPLIRYRLGDRGSLLANPLSCTCGRNLQIVASIEGRSDDVLYTVDGKRIGRLDPVFKGDLSVCEAQIIQEKLGSVQVRYVPAANFTPKAGQSLVNRIQARMGPIEVILKKVDAIPRGANGKFRAVICNLPPEQRKLLRGINSEGAAPTD